MAGLRVEGKSRQASSSRRMEEGLAFAGIGERLEEVEEGPTIADGTGAGGTGGELGVKVGEGEGIGGSAGRCEMALDGLGYGEFIGGEGGSHATREEPMGEADSAGDLVGGGGGGVDGRYEAENELLDEIAGFRVVHGHRLRDLRHLGLYLTFLFSYERVLLIIRLGADRGNHFEKGYGVNGGAQGRS